MMYGFKLPPDVLVVSTLFYILYMNVSAKDLSFLLPSFPPKEGNAHPDFGQHMVFEKDPLFMTRKSSQS